ncbi:MAG TPA: sulfatase [Candidatus Binatia bacterium]
MSDRQGTNTRKVLLGIAGAIGLVGALLLVVSSWRRAPRQPNVLLVSIDSLRHDHLGCYGYERDTSPTIDTLAREGALFRQAIAPSSWTLPSHVTLLTAKPPEQHGVVRANTRLAAGTPTLARALHDAGYRTAAFVAAPFLRSLYGYADGFEVYDERLAAKGNLDSHRGVTSPTLVEAVNGWIRRWHDESADRPFFVFLHMWDVHYDFDPPPPYDAMFDPGYRGSVNGRNFELGNQVHRDMDPRDLQHVIALYDGEIRYTDEHLGRVLEELRELGVLDDTLVIVTSDHGEEFFEHGQKGHGKALYDETIRIPLVMRYPRGIAAGTVVDEQVRLMDVAPTILGFTGVAAPPGFGAGDVEHRERDLRAWLAPSTAQTELPELIAFSELSLRGRPLYSARTPQLKTIAIGRQRVAHARYDLAADPGETRNLVGASPVPEGLARLEQAHAAWHAHWRDQAMLAKPVQLDEEHAGRLRALGYID